MGSHEAYLTIAQVLQGLLVCFVFVSAFVDTGIHSRLCAYRQALYYWTKLTILQSFLKAISVPPFPIHI